MDRVLLTPHVAASCRGQKERAYAVAAEQITRFANGDDLTNLVHGEY
jgi:phosphoglycerate dehydrogenase-like enzyme